MQLVGVHSSFAVWWVGKRPTIQSSTPNLSVARKVSRKTIRNSVFPNTGEYQVAVEVPDVLVGICNKHGAAAGLQVRPKRISEPQIANQMNVQNVP